MFGFVALAYMTTVQIREYLNGARSNLIASEGCVILCEPIATLGTAEYRHQNEEQQMVIRTAEYYRKIAHECQYDITFEKTVEGQLYG